MWEVFSRLTLQIMVFGSGSTLTNLLKSPSEKSDLAGQPPDEDHDGCGVEECSGRGEGRLWVLPETAIAADPGEELFDHPAARMHGKADLIGRLAHDLDRDDRGGRRPVASIACNGERLGDEREGPTRQAQHRHGCVAVLYVGRPRIEDERARPCRPAIGACAR